MQGRAASSGPVLLSESNLSSVSPSVNWECYFPSDSVEDKYLGICETHTSSDWECESIKHLDV